MPCALGRVEMVEKARLRFKLISAIKNANGHILTLNLKNTGSRILKNMVVHLIYLSHNFSTDPLSSFVYALMPNADETITFSIPVSSLKLVWFSVSGYANGDTHFSIESPLLTVRSKEAEMRFLLT